MDRIRKLDCNDKTVPVIILHQSLPNKARLSMLTNTDNQTCDIFASLSNIVDDNADGVNSPGTDKCTTNMLEIELTVEDILKRQLKFTIENYKPAKRVMKTKLISDSNEKPQKHGKNATSSDDCEQIVYQENNIQKKKPETDNSQFQCEYCTKIYNNKVSYVNHTKIHTGLKVMCEVKFVEVN